MKNQFQKNEKGTTATLFPFLQLTTKFSRLGIILLIFIFFALPVIRLMWMSFSGENGLSFEFYNEILSDSRTWEVLGNTLIVVLGSMTIATILGVTIAWLIAYTNLHLKGIIQLLIFLPFVIPSYVSSLAWVQFFRSKGLFSKIVGLLGINIGKIDLYNFGGIIFVMGITMYPLVYMFTVNAFRQIPRDAEIAAKASGASSWTAFSRITVPMALPGIAGGMFIAFLGCLDNFGIPAFLGTPANIDVLTTYIYQQIIGFGPTAFNRASVLSMLLTLIALIVMAFQWMVTRKSRALETGKIDLKPRYILGRSGWLIEMLLWLFLITTSILPLISLVVAPLIKAVGLDFSLENLSLKNYEFVLNNPQTQSAIFTSLKLAGISSVVILCFASVFAYFRVRFNNGFLRVIEAFITIPYALPGTVFALSMIFAWMQPFHGWNPEIYGSIWILYIAYITRFMIVQVRSAITAFGQVDESIEEASEISGSRGRGKWLKVMLPLILPSILSGTVLVFLQALTELTVSSLLYSSISKTIGVQVLSYQQAGYTLNATAFSSVIVGLIILTYLVILIIQKFVERKR